MKDITKISANTIIMILIVMKYAHLPKPPLARRQTMELRWYPKTPCAQNACNTGHVEIPSMSVNFSVFIKTGEVIANHSDTYVRRVN